MKKKIFIAFTLALLGTSVAQAGIAFGKPLKSAPTFGCTAGKGEACKVTVRDGVATVSKACAGDFKNIEACLSPANIKKNPKMTETLNRSGTCVMGTDGTPKASNAFNEILSQQDLERINKVCKFIAGNKSPTQIAAQAYESEGGGSPAPSEDGVSDGGDSGVADEF